MAEAEYVPLDATPTSASVLVRFTGEVDIASAHRAGDEPARVSNRARHEGVVIDLSKVTFMDCCGLSVLVRAGKALGNRLSLHNPSPAVIRLLELAILRDAFALTDDHA